ncbi:MAG: UV DNA damage repair endonuclease UvsE [Rhodothermales bacterium]|nr:UV DNA damage repair endonuclease UvsE [Rhodothermales bacterium]
MRLRHLGYACLNITLGVKSRTVRLANLRTEKVIPVVQQNLQAILDMVRWNAEHGIHFLRVSSDVVPFATLDAFPFDWAEAYDWMFRDIRREVKAHGMRVSSHPGQYTVLNSPREEVVADSVKELDHQAKLLRLIDPVQGTLTLHVGGAYGDKPAAVERFAANVERLSDEARGMLTLENDDTTYDLDDVLPLCERLGLPLVFDYFHHLVYHRGDDPHDGLTEKLERVSATWGRRVPKLHLSSQQPGGRRGAHADYVRPDDLQRFLDLMDGVGGDAPYDLMLEAKQKERATLDLMAYLRGEPVPDRFADGTVFVGGAGAEAVADVTDGVGAG